MKKVRFSVSLEPFSGVMEYEDEDYEDAVESGEIYYHGLDFLGTEERLVLTHELEDEDE